MVAQHTTSTAQFVALDNWRAAPEEAPGGAFTAVGIHALDYMIVLAGRVHELRCVTARNYPGRSDDTTSILLQFADGATGLMFCSVATATNFEFIAYGTDGLGEISRPDLSRLRFAPAATEAPTGLIPAQPDEIVEFSSFDMLHAELTAFARTIREEALSGPDRRRPAWHGRARRHRGVGAKRRDSYGPTVKVASALVVARHARQWQCHQLQKWMARRRIATPRIQEEGARSAPMLSICAQQPADDTAEATSLSCGSWQKIVRNKKLARFRFY